jgi:hypothetical protein
MNRREMFDGCDYEMPRLELSTEFSEICAFSQLPVVTRADCGK